MTLTERVIQRALMLRYRSSLQCACPNFTPNRWWECDLWAVTNAGYVVEYEIKLSVADFHADRSKWMDRRDSATGEWVRTEKHACLASGDCVPSRFYFVTSEAIAETIEQRLPDWAGLIKVRPSGRWPQSGLVKNAPRLHGRKVADGEIARAMQSTYYRYWDALQTIIDLQSQLSMLKGASR